MGREELNRIASMVTCCAYTAPNHRLSHNCVICNSPVARQPTENLPPQTLMKLDTDKVTLTGITVGINRTYWTHCGLSERISIHRQVVTYMYIYIVSTISVLEIMSRKPCERPRNVPSIKSPRPKPVPVEQIIGPLFRTEHPKRALNHR